MSEITPEIIKDFGDGEVEIKIIANFVYFRPNTSIVDMVAEFQVLMDKYAI